MAEKKLIKKNSLASEFKEFVMRGNVFDMAVGIIIGIAFGAIVNSLVQDIIMPPIGLLLGKVDFTNLFVVLKEGLAPGPYLSLSAAKDAGAVTLNYGIFVNALITFIIVSLVIFIFIKIFNKLKRKKEPVNDETKKCPYCFSMINIGASRCPNCTSQLK